MVCKKFLKIDSLDCILLLLIFFNFYFIYFIFLDISVELNLLQAMLNPPKRYRRKPIRRKKNKKKKENENPNLRKKTPAI